MPWFPRGTVKLVLMVALALVAAAACGTSPVDPTIDRLTGQGQFSLRIPDGPPLQVYYVGGQSDLSSAQVVLVLHGVRRNAADYRDAWVPLVEGRNVVVVAPEFPTSSFPDATGYNLGGLGSDGNRARAFDYIEPLFAEVVRRVGGHQRTFDMFGHSAGAQFIHRYVEFAPRTALRTAVAANAGWYTSPDEATSYPYGMGAAPGSPDPAVYLRRDLFVLLGADDVEDENLRKDRAAMRQGGTRLERGLNFYLSARQAAQRHDVELAWRLEIVPGVAHDHGDMAGFAAKRLLNE